LSNPDVKALATWEVDSVGNATGIPASMYLRLGNYTLYKIVSDSSSFHLFSQLKFVVRL
jgi:hypothetical protein